MRCPAPRRPTRAFVLARAPWVLGFAATVIAFSCSLGLDESLIDRHAGADGLPDGALADGPTSTGPGEGGAPDASGPITCADDGPCTTSDGCLKGHCDLGRHACVFSVCRSSCASATCAVPAHTCGASTPYKYRVTQIPVGAPVCGHCAAAVYPWLFTIVPSQGSIVAFDVSNPANAAPVKVPVTGLGFAPTQIVASGNRVWVTGSLTPSAPSAPIGYIDVPTDPFTANLVAATATATYTSGRPTGFFLLPRSNQSVVLVGPDAQFPSAFVEAPFANPLKVTATPIPASPGDAPGVMSGTRLLMESTGVAGTAAFHFIEGVGGPNPQSGTVTQLASVGAVGPSSLLASSDQGAIFWSVAALQAITLPLDPMNVRAVHGSFLVDGDAAAINANPPGVDVEVYDDVDNVVAAGTGVVGPVAMLDANTAMVPTLARETPNATAVQFVQRAPLGVVKEADGKTPRRTVLPLPVSTFIAATSSNGVAYLVANDPTPPNAATVYVFDFGCGL